MLTDAKEAVETAAGRLGSLTMNYRVYQTRISDAPEAFTRPGNQDNESALQLVRERVLLQCAEPIL